MLCTDDDDAYDDDDEDRFPSDSAISGKDDSMSLLRAINSVDSICRSSHSKATSLLFIFGWDKMNR